MTTLSANNYGSSISEIDYFHRSEDDQSQPARLEEKMINSGVDPTDVIPLEPLPPALFDEEEAVSINGVVRMPTPDYRDAQNQEPPYMALPARASCVIANPSDEEAVDNAPPILEATLVIPPLPWWKRRRMVLFLGIALVCLGALAVAFGVSSSSDKNASDVVTSTSPTKQPTISYFPTMAPTIAPSVSSTSAVAPLVVDPTPPT